MKEVPVFSFNDPHGSNSSVKLLRLSDKSAQINKNVPMPMSMLDFCECKMVQFEIGKN